MNASMCKYVLTLKILSKITMASSSLINWTDSKTMQKQRDKLDTVLWKER
jgi:hypothetical protein